MNEDYKAEEERVYDPPCSFEVTIANRILLPFTVTAPSAVEAGKKALEMLAAMTTEQWLAKIASYGWEDDDSVDVISVEKD